MRTSEALESAVALLGDGPMADLDLLDALGYEDDAHEVLTFLRALRADGRIVLLGDGRAVLRDALGQGLTGWHRLTAEEAGARTVELGVELVLLADLVGSIDPVQVGDDAVALRHAEDADGEPDLARGPLLVLPEGWEPGLAEGDLVGLVARDGALALVRGPSAADVPAEPPIEAVTALVAALDEVAAVEGEGLMLPAAPPDPADPVDVDDADEPVDAGAWVLHLDRVGGVLLADHGDVLRALDRPLGEVLAATGMRVEDGAVLGPGVGPQAWLLHRTGRDILFDAFPDEWPEPGHSEQAGLVWLSLSTEGDPLPATAVAEWLEEPMVAEAIAARLDQVPDHVVARALGLLDDVRDQAGTEVAVPPDGLRGVALVTGRALLLEGRLPEAAAVLEDAFADLSFEWPAGVELLGLLRAVAGDVDGAVGAYGELGEDGVVDRLLAWVPTPPVGVGRNAPCPCGSGRKFKQCCLRRPPALGLEARVPFLWWKLQMTAVELLGRHVPDVSEPHATAEVGAVAVDALLLEGEAILDVARMLDPLLPDDERALLASWGVPSRTVLEVVARDGDALVVRDLVAGGEHRIGADVLDHGGVGTRVVGVVVAGASADGPGHLVGPVVHLTAGTEAVVDAFAEGLDAQAVVDLVEELIGSSSNAHIH